MADGDLCQITDVQTWLGSTAPAAEPLIARLITAASRAICNYCDRDSFATQAYTELYDGDGQARMLLRQWPAASVQSVTVRRGHATDTITDPDDFTLEPPLSGGGVQRLILHRLIFPRGRSNVTVSYTAGYDDPPFDVAQACIELTGEAYRRRDRIGQASVSMKDQSTVSFSQADMNASIKTMLSNYRRLIPC
jgi:uncharacterized phiE125 gp8 family phage protein